MTEQPSNDAELEELDPDQTDVADEVLPDNASIGGVDASVDVGSAPAPPVRNEG